MPAPGPNTPRVKMRYRAATMRKDNRIQIATEFGLCWFDVDEVQFHPGLVMSVPRHVVERNTLLRIGVSRKEARRAKAPIRSPGGRDIVPVDDA